MHHSAQAGVDRAAPGRIFSRREVDLRAVGIDWASRRIDDRDRTRTKLGDAIRKHLGQSRDAIGASNLIQGNAHVAQLAAARRDRCDVEIVFADIDSDDRGVARDIEVQELGRYRSRYSRRPPITFFTWSRVSLYAIFSTHSSSAPTKFADHFCTACSPALYAATA